jgi:hypothetical protein
VSLMSRRKDPSYEGVPEEIERLADLRDKGVISDKDFQNMKKQLIQGDGLPAQRAAEDRPTRFRLGGLSRAALLRGAAAEASWRANQEVRDIREWGGLMGSVRAPDRPIRRSFDPTPVEPSGGTTTPSAYPRRGLMGSVKRPPSPISSRNRGYVEVYYCANCNKRVGKTARFCKNCGLQL